jgi:hypothetical protein
MLWKVAQTEGREINNSKIQSTAMDAPSVTCTSHPCKSLALTPTNIGPFFPILSPF